MKVTFKGGITMKLEFFEQSICLCSSNVDEGFIKLHENVEILKNKYEDITVERYIISQQPGKFKENADVFELVKEKGKEVLPIVTLNGKIMITEHYPTLEEIENLI